MSESKSREGFVRRLGRAVDDPRPSRVAAIAVAALLFLPIAALVLVSIANLVPDWPIMDELFKSVQAGLIEPGFRSRSTSGRLVDTWSDCHTITIGLGDAPGTSRWSAALRSPTLGSCEYAAPNIEGWANGEGLTREWEYFRYWHGTAAFSRPAIATIGLVGARIVTGWLLVAAAVGLAGSIVRRHGAMVSVALLGPFLFTTDVLDLPASLHQAWAVLAVLVMAWLGHEVVWRRVTTGRIVLISLSAGSVFVFFDLLTIPPGAWALTVVVVVLAASRRVDGVGLALIGALAVGGWAVGYASMWVAKWVLAIPVYGYERVRTEIVYQTTFRLDGQPNYQIDLSFGAGVRRMWDVWTQHPLAWPVLFALIAMVTAAIVVRWLRSTVGSKYRAADRVIVAAPTLLPLIWFEVVRNHTQIHEFPARSVPIAIGILAVAIIVRLPALNDQSSAPVPVGDATPRATSEQQSKPV